MKIKKFNRVFLVILLVCTMMLTACAGRQKLKLSDGVVVYGQAYVPDDCKVILHFSTWQRTDSAFEVVRKARARSQFICFDNEGEITNSFSVNREIFNHPIVRLNSITTVGYVDFNLNCSSDGITFIDDSTSLDEPGYTGIGANVTGYIKESDTAYYLLNLGGGVIDGQYTTILRFVNSETSYDVIIPYSICYIAYDRICNRFIYRVRNHSDDFFYGYIDYDAVTGRYCYNEPATSISIQSTLEKYGEEVYDGYRILLEDNIVYEIFAVSVNENVLNDLDLSADYLTYSKYRWGVMILRRLDLNNGTSEVEYLTKTPFEGDTRYGFDMAGTQQMPQAAVNGSLYYFTNDEKLSVYNPQTGFVRYDIKFNDAGMLPPDDLFGSDSRDRETEGKFRSPIKISADGNLYTAHAYSDGTIKIHKYDFSNQCFNLYWTSDSGVLDKLDKRSLRFVSFEVID